jgi:hypothetical protein
MPCPFHGGDDGDDSQRRRDGPPGAASDDVPRREFVKAALAIGGSAALSACLDREFGGTETDAGPSFPEGPDDPDEAYPRRQFRWNDAMAKDPHGGTVAPRHQLLLFLDYAGSWPPSDDERGTVESALTTVERAFQRGTGGDVSAIQTKGLLHSLAYSRSYFDRYDEPLPESVDLPPAREVLRTLGEDPENADEHDAMLLLTSDYASLLLSVEAALFGDADSLNGLDVAEGLTPVFDVADRRTGFMGRGVASDAAEQVPENAPLSMGYSSAFEDTLPSEDKMTIEKGPFAGGTTLQASKLVLDLDAWYDREEADRVELMFSPEHTPEQVGETGSGLGDHSGITTDLVESADDHAEQGRLGHSQKAARARDDDFEPVILRRSEGINTDDDRTGFNFTSVQRRMSDFLDTREAMNGEAFDDVDTAEHGILDFLEVTNRASLLVPPRELRAFPRPQP